jgi:Xaa-Pro dipeptidase
MTRPTLALGLIGLAVSLAAVRTPPPADGVPKLLPWSEQIRVRESWLPKRYQMLLPMMRRQSIDMWIIVNEEFHDDPVTQYIAPPRPYTGGRDIFVFVDAGAQGLKRIAVTGFAEENLRRFFESPEDPRPATEVLPDIFKTYNPKKIAVNIGGTRGVTRSLTHDSYLFLSKTMGPDATSRFVSAADLIEEYFDTRIPEELEYYTNLVRVTENLARRSLSNEVITPGKTTVGDVRRWLYDQLGAASARTWFQPDLRVYAKGVENKMSRGFPAVADESTVIQRGNVIHLDFGLTAMGFDTDWQRDAYVLRDGERDVPDGLKRAMANTHLLQDALMLHAARPGLTAGEVTEKAQTEMEQKGIEARMYCHPEGNQGHGLGTGVGYGFRANSQRDPSRMTKRLRNGSYISIELNTQTPVPEWGGQKVLIAFEDPAYLTNEGFKFFVPRQEQFYLIK